MPTVTPKVKGSYSIRSVHNALDVLEALSDEEDDIRISRLSEKLGMNKTSVFRLMATFEDRGYVEREKSTGKYRLGLAAGETGQKILSRMELVRKARPIMEHLVRECNETCYLAVPRGAEVLFLDMVDTPQQVKIAPLVGRRFPRAATAAGRIFPPTGQVASRPSPARTAGGGVYEGQKLGEGIVDLAVPVFARAGTIAACLCLVGPGFRLPPEKIRADLNPRLLDAGDTLSSRLGYPGFQAGHPAP